METAPFSPLFIGEVSSTHRLAMVCASPCSSFSPLFIGEVSSTLQCRRLPRGLYGLSVPSSSGKSLQPEHRTSVDSARRAFQSPLHRGSLFNNASSAVRSLMSKPFSPLFIGEVSSTLERPHWLGLGTLFQSPLHRGSLFNVTGTGVNFWTKVAFSPLFIGEVSSTCQPAR